MLTKFVLMLTSCSRGLIVVGRARKAAKEGILCATLTCQAQNRTAIPSKSGDGSHTLRLTGATTAVQPVKNAKMILRDS